MIRLLLVSPYTLPFYCGNSFLADRLRKGLTERGHDVLLCNSTRDTPHEATSFQPHLLHSLNAERPHVWVDAFLEKQPVPWVITLTGTDYTTWCGIKDPPPQVRRDLERADRLVVFHREAAESLCQCLPTVTRKIRVVPQGIRPSVGRKGALQIRRENGMESTDLVFLMVSSIRTVKNIGSALDAFFEIERSVPGAKLVLIGPILEQEEADRVLRKGRRLKSFRYIGAKTPSEVREFMRASDVFLNTSLSEGMPGAVMEAMAEGLPVLVSSVTGNRSLVEQERNGLLFSIGRKEELIQSAVRLATDERLRSQLGKAARERVERHYSVDQELDCYEKLYYEMLRRPEDDPPE